MKTKEYLTEAEIIRKLLKSKKNTVFVNKEQVKNTLSILKKMGVLKGLK